MEHERENERNQDQLNQDPQATQGQQSPSGQQNSEFGSQSTDRSDGQPNAQASEGAAIGGQTSTGQAGTSGENFATQGDSDTLTQSTSAEDAQQAGNDPNASGFVGQTEKDSGDYLQERGEKKDSDIDGTSGNFGTNGE